MRVLCVKGTNRKGPDKGLAGHHQGHVQAFVTQRVTRDPLEFHLLSHSPETELNTEG